jgi:rhodanese-related sulfurtransferase
MKVLQAVAQANSAQTVPKTVQTRIKALPKQASRLAAAILANSAAAKIALADDGLALPEFTVPDVTLPEVALPPVDTAGITDLVADNPILVGGGLLLLALPVGINLVLGAASGGSGLKPTTVTKALDALQQDERVVLVDIRSRAEAKAQGSPDLRSIKRSAIALPYTSVVKGEVVVDENFADKFGRLKGISEESLVILLDADGGDAGAAASEVADTVAKMYFVQGGAEQWAESGPWRQPSAGLSLSLPDLRSLGSSVNNLAEDFKKTPTVGKAGLAAAAIAGAGLLIFNEVEVVLELAGLVAGGNFLLKLLFADEREKVRTRCRSRITKQIKQCIRRRMDCFLI